MVFMKELKSRANNFRSRIQQEGGKIGGFRYYIHMYKKEAMLPAGVFINYITTTQAPPRVVWSFLWWTSMTMGYLLDGVMGCTLNASLSPSSSNSSPNHNELYSPNKKLPF